ncbi:hypothetical protein D0Z00_002406 [Geotrichum galactomycetum]|uniref:Uncharacterized protein n=1 Tax=Geotrichum galactomycetum TaxID=27317 RepID=A0ACB6V4A7_9ASCO|nr:hypothetical protein D0Z00_002406 [Geotrichum candidum]
MTYAIGLTDIAHGNKVYLKKVRTDLSAPEGPDEKEEIDFGREMRSRISQLEVNFAYLVVENKKLRRIVAKQQTPIQVKTGAQKRWSEAAQEGEPRVPNFGPNRKAPSPDEFRREQIQKPTKDNVKAATATRVLEPSPAKRFARPLAVILKPDPAWENLNNINDNDVRKARGILDKKVAPTKIVGIRESKKENINVEIKNFQADTVATLS